MARGQDAPVKSGQMDPYVQQSLLQGKEQSNNRLVAAMQQAGSAQRQKQAGTQAAVQQGMQGAQERQMLAAQMAQQDKRAAEAEQARREDQKFQSLESGINRNFQSEQANLQREFLKAQAEDDRNAEKELRQQMLDAQELQFIRLLESTERSVNAGLSVTKTMANNESANQKLITMEDKEKERLKMARENFGIAKDNIIKGAKQDKLMDMPVPKSLWERMKATKAEQKKTISLGEVARDITPAQGIYRGVTAAKKSWETMFPEGTANPKSVLQSQINKNQSSVNISDLMPDKSHQFVDEIINKKITPMDIRGAWAGLKAYEEVLDEKLEGLKEDTVEEKFWRKERGDIDLMETTITQLLYNDKKVSETETVGSKIRDAIGPIEGFSLGSVLEKKQQMMKAAGVKDPMALYNELTKSIEPYKYREYPEGSSKYLRDLIDRENAALEPYIEKRR